MSKPLGASWPAANQVTNSQIHVSVYKAIGTNLVRTKQIVLGFWSCFNLVWRAVCHSEWLSHPKRALAGKQANSSQNLAALSPCWQWQAGDGESGVGLHCPYSLVAVCEGRFLNSTNNYGPCSNIKSFSKQDLLKVEGQNSIKWNKYFVWQQTSTYGTIPKDCETQDMEVAFPFPDLHLWR